MKRRFAGCLALLGCASATPSDSEPGSTPTGREPSVTTSTAPQEEIPVDPWSVGPPLGSRKFANGDIEVRVRAPSATRIELCLFAKALGEKERLRLLMDHEKDGFRLRVPASILRRNDLGEVLYYGLRVFGPNWPWEAGFVPGTEHGFLADVDEDGNRMNPNKVLLDPYALETSHDPINLVNGSGAAFRTGPGLRAIDSAEVAPKGIIVSPPLARPAGQPSRPIRSRLRGPRSWDSPRTTTLCPRPSEERTEEQRDAQSTCTI